MLKQKFDDIFASTRYVKALDSIRKLRQEQVSVVNTVNFVRKTFSIVRFNCISQQFIFCISVLVSLCARLLINLWMDFCEIFVMSRLDFGMICSLIWENVLLLWGNSVKNDAFLLKNINLKVSFI